MTNVVALRAVGRKTQPIENRKVAMPRRVPNRDRRSREYLTPDEVEKLMASAAKLGRHGHRDSALFLLAYRHALRVGEIVALRWDQIDLKQGLLHVNRLKNGVASTHPLRGPELRSLRRLKRDYPGSAYVFVTERGGPMTADNVRKLITRAGEAAELPFSPSTLTCCATPRASSSPMRGTIPEQSSTTWATGTSSTRCGTLRWPRTGSRTFGGTEPGARRTATRLSMEPKEPPLSPNYEPMLRLITELVFEDILAEQEEAARKQDETQATDPQPKKPSASDETPFNPLVVPRDDWDESRAYGGQQSHPSSPTVDTSHSSDKK